jgi:HEAT repeat protein
MRRLLLIAVLVCLVISAVGQVSPSAKPSVSDLLTSLHSKDWTERSNALDILRSDRSALRSRKVQAELIDLLDRENQEADKRIREAQTLPLGEGEENDEVEGRGEYCSWLSETVDSFADWSNPREACILVRAAYVVYPSSNAQSAVRAKAAMPCLLQMAGDDLIGNRVIGIPMLVEALAKGNDAIDPGTALKAKQLILSGLRDPNDGVRMSTVNGLAKFGNADMIPPLKVIAETDPSSEIQGHSIRKWAAKAIADIQRRARQ